MNAAEIPILSIMLAVPMVGALACLFMRAEMARVIALTATLFNLLLGIWLWASYDP
ncbi:MAG: NADH-quinone oxidoreductase subunit M, partial [Sphingomonadales bacterium]